MLCSIQIDPLGQSLVEVALVPVGFPHRADELSAQVHRDLGNPSVEWLELRKSIQSINQSINRSID